MSKEEIIFTVAVAIVGICTLANIGTTIYAMVMEHRLEQWKEKHNDKSV